MKKITAHQAIETIANSDIYKRLASLYGNQDPREDAKRRSARIKARLRIVLNLGRREIPALRECVLLEELSLFDRLITEKLQHFSALWPAVKAGVFIVE